MPTVGWIVEDAIDRYWENQPLPKTDDAPPRTFTCSRCGQVFNSSEKLRQHYLSHPLALPGLLVRGELLATESAVRSPVRNSDIELVECTSSEVQIDGSAWSRWDTDRFRTAFAGARSESWNVRLLNDRADDESQARAMYRVRFRIPKAGDLNEVDKQFVERLAKEDLTHDDLREFESRLPQEIAAREYGAALGDYALGVLLKERRGTPHSQVRFEEFADKMRSALDVLRVFDSRPVAAAVCATIRFNLNDFRVVGSTFKTEIELGLSYFRRLAGMSASSIGLDHETHSPKRASRRPLCSIDRMSHTLVRACERSASDVSELEEIVRGDLPVSETDLIKLHVLCADGYLRIRRSADAKRHLLAVQFDPTFRDWARQRIEQIETHG